MQRDDDKQAEPADRARRLLADCFTGLTAEQRQAILDRAFQGLTHDPRGRLNNAGSADEFATHCVSRLMDFGCTDGRRHALSRLLVTLREERGTHPPPDLIDLPPLLDGRCALPGREEEHAYLQALLADCRAKAAKYASLRGVARCAAAIPVAADLEDQDDIALLSGLRRRAPTQCEPPVETRDYPHILEAFGQVPRAALLGQPGAGKSTTLRRLAADRAAAALEQPAAPLPILVNLGAWTGGEDLAAFLAVQAPGVGAAAAALAQAGRLILLLDGLNEVPTAQRAAKGAALRAFLGTLPAVSPVVVSCRADDYVDDLDLGFDTLTLQPLSPQRVRDVLVHWLTRADPVHGKSRAQGLFWQLAGDPALESVLAAWRAAGADEDLFWNAPDIPRESPDISGKTGPAQDALWRRHVRDPRGLLRLAANPFMLTMLYLVWHDRGGILPRNRGDLFDRFVENLLRREGLAAAGGDPDGSARYTPVGERLLAALTGLAWVMQGRRSAEGGVDAVDPGVLTLVTRTEARSALGGESLLKKALDATLLEGSDGLRFRHQLLQEYFTARAMQARLRDGTLHATDLWPAAAWWKRSGWEESAALLAGLHPQDCAPIIRWLRDAQPELAAQCLLDSGAEVAERPALLDELRAAWLPRLTDVVTDPAPEARAAVGRALGQLGLDNRRGVGLTAAGLPDIDWVPIDGGEFLYQDGERRRVDPFQIARFPVTNAQFRAFLADPEGYANDRWWRALTDPQRNPAAPAWDLPNHPRETVSWHEAMAFCAWLGERLGFPVSLPTEWQWERAARGTSGREYPWNDGYRVGMANINETWVHDGPHSLGRTSAVGIYPQGASVEERVLDLSGNVWEWCLNEYAKPQRIQLGGVVSRVVRGGSWFDVRSLARAGYRFPYHPRSRDHDFGFRLVCAAPIR